MKCIIKCDVVYYIHEVLWCMVDRETVILHGSLEKPLSEGNSADAH